MTIQTEIDFVSRPQNSKENQEILDTNKPHLNNQCLQVLEMLQKGMVLTTTKASAGIWLNGKKIIIGDLRARIRDLIVAGYPIKKEKIKGRFKKYFIVGG